MTGNSGKTGKAGEAEDADLVYLHKPTEDGEGMNALRLRQGKIELAEVRPIVEGRHLGSSEIVKLHPRENPKICDVETVWSGLSPEDREAAADALASAHDGPRRVATDSFRRNWERIFGKDPVIEIDDDAEVGRDLN